MKNGKSEKNSVTKANNKVVLREESTKTVAKKDILTKAEKSQKGARPKNPLPAQHQKRPGIESKIEPRPQYLAPDYKGSEKLKNKVALITGGDSGIGRAVAVLFAREGADVGLVFLPEEKQDAQNRRADRK